MSDFAKALRGNIASSRCSVEVPATWSAHEDLARGFENDLAESFSSFESNANLDAEEIQSTTTGNTSKAPINAPEIESGSLIVVISQEADESIPGPGPPQPFTIPADWEQAASKAKLQNEILGCEGPEWIKLPEGGGWWKGNMTWI